MMSGPDTLESNQRSFGPGALLTPANMVTVARLLASPVAFVLILTEEYSWRLVALWFVLTTTDSLDGYLARKQGATRSGAFLDPLADKVMALGGLWAMVATGRFMWLPVVLISLREVLISAFRTYWGRRGLAVPASKVAKFKTFLQFGAVGWVVLPPTHDVTWLADGFLWLGVAVAWISAAQYLIAGSTATSTTGDR
ncbi:MAG: CDP-alcohol phosphatidyltransferase family protein [Microthrixaceae bacterium]